MHMAEDLAYRMRSNESLSLKERLSIVGRLSLPGILAQISDIIMQYIDAAMVGVLGAAASASIGLVSSSTWLLGGIYRAAAAGFSVQVAHAVGAGDLNKAKSIFKQSLLSALALSVIVAVIASALAFRLPAWLGADQQLWHDATMYLLCFCIFIPFRQLEVIGVNMLQCSGDMKTPSILMTLMCFLDVVFNFFLIFPSRNMTLFGHSIFMPGAGLGVLGAQLGTSLAVVVVSVILMYFAAVRSRVIAIKGFKGRWVAEKKILSEALRIGTPMAMEHSALCLAQIASTRIIAPLGTTAIAAHSFAVTAESICYMPGYGISMAATTLVGQAIGARRKDLARSFAWLTTYTGMAIMTLTGAIMYFICPAVFAFLTPVEEVQLLGTQVLRIELLAEPLFGASIVATGALRGAGDTLVPGILNLVSIWGVRITLAFFLTKTMGLPGAWIAMAVELNVRGILFLIRLKREKWLKTAA